MNAIRRMLHCLALLLSLEPAGMVRAAEPSWQEQQNLPEWAQAVFGATTFSGTYALTTRINPFFLHGDFNGDGKLDVAALIAHRANGKQGIAVAHAGSPTAIVVGAGTKLGNGSDDFAWLDAWSLYVKRPIQQGATGKKPPTLLGDALLVQKLEAASAVIYWDGKGYRWYQQGD